MLYDHLLQYEVMFYFCYTYFFIINKRILLQKQSYKYGFVTTSNVS